MTSTETLHVKSVMTTQDGVHIAWCKVERDRCDAQVTTPVRMTAGDIIHAVRAGRDWRFVSTPTETSDRP